jgi:hypothetical protein
LQNIGSIQRLAKSDVQSFPFLRQKSGAANLDLRNSVLTPSENDFNRQPPLINILSDSSGSRDKENMHKTQLSIPFNPTFKQQKHSDYVYGNENLPKKVWSKN